MILPVNELAGGPEHLPERTRGGAGHLVVDGAFLFEPERVIGVLGDAEIAHLAADLFIGVVRIQERVELRVEQLEEDLRTCRGVEDIVRPPLAGVGARLREPHRVQPRERSSRRPFPDEEMLLRVRLPLIGNRKRIHPRMRLRHRLDLQQIEREPALSMNEPGTDRMVGIVEVDGGDGETADVMVPGELGEIDGGEGGHGQEQSEDRNQDAHDAAHCARRARETERWRPRRSESGVERLSNSLSS